MIEMDSVRILVVSFFYPPETGVGTIGAARVGKTAQLLARAGHQVQALTADTGERDKDSAPPEVPVTRTPWIKVNGLPKTILEALRRASPGHGSDLTASAAVKPPEFAARNLADLYMGLTNLPDETIGWVPWAIRAGRALVDKFRPELIFASGAPFSAFLVASALARRAQCPWVGELRDLWVDNHYYRFPEWRKPIDRRIEGRMLRTASGLVTVSKPLAEVLRARYNTQVEVILNGFDPDDYPAEEPTRATDTLRLLYAGRLYGERRDPAPLFEAIARLGSDSHKLQLDLYVPGDGPRLQQMAEQAGIGHAVRLHDPITHRKILELEAAADVLLLLLWNHPAERGVFTGKFFEYLGARRPVLALAPDCNVAAQMIAERNLGFASLDPGAISTWLRARIAEKARGIHPTLDGNTIGDLTRERQTARLEHFLLTVVCGKPPRNFGVIR